MTAPIFEMQNIADRGAEAGFFNFVSQFYTLKCSYDSNGKLEYYGYAYPGTETDETGWLIVKCTYDASQRITDRKTAGGNPDFAYIYDNRAGYTYS